MATGLKVLSKAQLAMLAVQGVAARQSIIDWKLYDEQDVAMGGTTRQLTYFQQAVAGSITLETTNMEIGGQLPKDHAFVIEQILFRAKPAVGVDAPEFVSDIVECTHYGWFELFIGTRPFYQDSILGAMGGGLHGWATAIAAGSPQYYAQGRVAEIAKFDYMPVVENNTGFSVKVGYATPPSPSAALTLRCTMKGKLIRPSLA